MSSRRLSSRIALPVLLSALLQPLSANAQLLPGSGPPADPRSTPERLLYFTAIRKDAEDRRNQDIVSASGDAQRAAEAASRFAQRLDGVPDVLPTNLWALVYYALPPRVLSDDFKRFLLNAERQRVDEQIGSSLAAGASTSTAARTGLATLFGFAVESGAVTQTVDQNVGTLRANADGLLRFLSNQDVIPTCAPTARNCASPGFLKNLELSASFTLSDGGMQTLSGTAATTGVPIGFSTLVNDRRLTSATARYAVLNNRDLRSSAYRAKWNDWFIKNQALLQAAGAELLSSIRPVTLQIRQVNEAGQPAGIGEFSQYTIWLAQTRGRLRDQPANEWERILREQLDVLLEKLRTLDPDFDRKMEDVGAAYARYFALQRSLSSTLVTDPALTVEYTYSQPPLQPQLNIVKFAWAYSPQPSGAPTNPGTVTLNAGVEFFSVPQPTGVRQNTSPWKDIQAAIQFDRPIGPPDSPTVLSVGGYFQHQLNPGVITIPTGATKLPGTTIPLPAAGNALLAEKGTHAAVQAVLTIRLSASGLKLPIGISWSNRTELVTGTQVSAHVGFTFDTSPLLLLPSR